MPTQEYLFSLLEMHTLEIRELDQVSQGRAGPAALPCHQPTFGRS